MYAHKAVLAARCDVLSAMFSGHFREGAASDTVQEVCETVVCLHRLRFCRVTSCWRACIHPKVFVLIMSLVLQIDIFETPHENFLALLEYLYTDHAPIEEGDSIGGDSSSLWHLKLVFRSAALERKGNRTVFFFFLTVCRHSAGGGPVLRVAPHQPV